MTKNLDDKFAEMARELMGEMPAFTKGDLDSDEMARLVTGKPGPATARARIMRGVASPEDFPPVPPSASEQLEMKRKQEIKGYLRDKLDSDITPKNPGEGP